TDQPDHERHLVLPFAWNDVHLYAGAATTLRVHMSPQGPDTMSVRLADDAGLPVAMVGSVRGRAVSVADLRGDTDQGWMRDALFQLKWAETTLAAPDSVTASQTGSAELPRVRTAADVAALAASASPHSAALAYLVDPAESAASPTSRTSPASPASPGTPEDVHFATSHLLDLIQRWLAEPTLTDARLVVVTPPTDDPVAAAGWGLVRSAQLEHPGRFLLVATDGADSLHSALPALLAGAEPQIALRQGTPHVPRVTRVPSLPDGETQQRDFDPDGTVLITGGTGALGRLVARHLVERHQVKNLLLTSRRGPDAPDADALHTELTALGADVRIAACDAADHDALADLLTSIPDTHPLTAVIHTAGVVDDGIITALTPDRLATVYRPKIDAALNLHHLTQNHHLTHFILFSSAASAFGSAGQANYAAANAFLDALAHHRHTHHQPATSLAWGGWSHNSLMTAGLTRADMSRMERGGGVGMTAQEGLALLDAALRRPDAPALLPVKLDLGVLHAQAEAGTLPTLLSGLVPTGRRIVQQKPVGGPGLAERLAAAPEGRREGIVLDVVRREVATTLGHASATDVDPDQGFSEIGFDSLLAVELRNKLSELTGTRLPATLVFDHPTPRSIARLLWTELAPATPSADEFADREAEIRQLLSGTPLARFQELGLMHHVLELVDGLRSAEATAATAATATTAPGGAAAAPHGPKPDDGPLIMEMDVDDLVARAMKKARKQ
ncbi:hypothetical protein ACM01_46165, partial [Streptomyces viridochromogenes]